MITYTKGNLFSFLHDIDVIVHGANIFCVMGRGFALELKHKFPQAYIADKTTTSGDKSKLGTFTKALAFEETRTIRIYNLYVQSRLAPGKVNVDRGDLENALKALEIDLARSYAGRSMRIGMPKICSGLGGLDWYTQVKPLISKYLSNHSVQVYTL